MRLLATISLAIVLIVSGALFYSDVSVAHLVSFIEANRLAGSAVLAVALVVSTVFAPFAALPLVPLAAPLLGPFTTGVVAMCSWTFGGTIAFLIARYGGRPLLGRFRGLETLATYESQIPPRTHFLLLVMLRMVIPVDVLSYTLGLISTVGMREFVLSTFVGVAWFSFAFAYLGEALLERDYVLFSVVGVASVIILLTALVYVRHHRR